MLGYASQVSLGVELSVSDLVTGAVGQDGHGYSAFNGLELCFCGAAEESE